MSPHDLLDGGAVRSPSRRTARPQRLRPWTLLLLSSIAGPALAEPRSCEDARFAQDRQLAAALEAKARWADALSIFEGLYQDCEGPQDLWSIARLQQRLGNDREAEKALLTYRARLPEPSWPPGRIEEEALLKRVLLARKAAQPASRTAPPCPDPARHEGKTGQATLDIDEDRLSASRLEGEVKLEEALRLRQSLFAQGRKPEDLWSIAVLAYLTGRPQLAWERLRQLRSRPVAVDSPGPMPQEELLEAMIRSELSRRGTTKDAAFPCPSPGDHRMTEKNRVPPPPSGLRIRRILGGVALSLGAAGLVAGAAGWGLREQAITTYNNDRSCLDLMGNTREMTCGDQLRFASSLQPLVIAGMAAGGVLAVTGAILLATSFPRGKADGVSWRLAPGPGLAGVGLDVSF